MKMCNVGGVDRGLRIIIGSVFVTLGFFVSSMGLTSGWQVVLWAVGGIGLVTGVTTVCPLYSLLRLNTCKPKSSEI